MVIVVVVAAAVSAVGDTAVGELEADASVFSRIELELGGNSAW